MNAQEKQSAESLRSGFTMFIEFKAVEDVKQVYVLDQLIKDSDHEQSQKLPRVLQLISNGGVNLNLNELYAREAAKNIFATGCLIVVGLTYLL